MIPNMFHSDKFCVEFSNIPNGTGKPIDIRLFNLYVKSIALPDMQLDTANTDFQRFSVRQVMSRANDSVQALSIEFKVSEDLRNYYALYSYMRASRYGQYLDKSEWVRQNTIKTLKVVCKDNQDREIGGFVFTNALIISLASLQLTQGTADNVTFAATFTYDECDLYTTEVFG